MRLKLLFILLSLLLVLLHVRQQLPLITQYMFINMAFNPGYTGSSDGINVRQVFCKGAMDRIQGRRWQFRGPSDVLPHH